MNFEMTQIPLRTSVPRTHGLTIISDKGISLQSARDMLSVSYPYIDMIKLAFGTPLLTPGIEEKIRLYQSANVPVYFGGLLLEVYFIRKQLDDYLRLLEKYNLRHIEISDGELTMSMEEKCALISRMQQYGMVLSEVGSKDQDKVRVTPPYKWIELMNAELAAGATYLVAESKEMGTVGLYRDSGEVREGLVEEILTKIPAEKIVWEVPEKDQQLYFIKRLGANANLGNILPKEVIALEAMRIGLRGDSFEFYLD